MWARTWRPWAKSAKLVTGFNEHGATFIFALLSLGLQLFIPYRRYARFLTVLTFSLFAYVALMFFVHLDWKAIGAGLIGLHPNLTDDAATTIVAIFGTTISPYLFFWQSAQEVEEVDQRPKARPLIEAPRQAPAAIARIRIDTIAGMFISNLIAVAIMIATAATLHAHGVTNINTAADAASALKPIAGRFAFALFSLGIIGTGLLAIPVLAGSAGYAVADALDWKTGLDNMPWQARGFYSVIGAAVLLGLGIDWSPLDPIKRALLERGAERRDRRADDGGFDVCRGQPPQDGRIPRRLGAGRTGLAVHRGNGCRHRYHDIRQPQIVSCGPHSG